MLVKGSMMALDALQETPVNTPKTCQCAPPPPPPPTPPKLNWMQVLISREQTYHIGLVHNQPLEGPFVNAWAFFWIFPSSLCLWFGGWLLCIQHCNAALNRPASGSNACILIFNLVRKHCWQQKPPTQWTRGFSFLACKLSRKQENNLGDQVPKGCKVDMFHPLA